MKTLLIAMLSALLLVAACGKKGDPNPPADPNAAQAQESKKKPVQ